MLPSLSSEQQPLRLNPAEISEVIAEVCSESTSSASQSIAPSRLSTQSRQPSADVAFSVLIKLVIDMYNSISHFFHFFIPTSNFANVFYIFSHPGIVVTNCLFTSFITDFMANQPKNMFAQPKLDRFSFFYFFYVKYFCHMDVSLHSLSVFCINLYLHGCVFVL